MANKHMKRYATSLAIKEMSVKTTMTNISILLIAIIQKTDNYKDLSYTTNGNVKCISHVWKHSGSPSNG